MWTQHSQGKAGRARTDSARIFGSESVPWIGVAWALASMVAGASSLQAFTTASGGGYSSTHIAGYPSVVFKTQTESIDFHHGHPPLWGALLQTQAEQAAVVGVFLFYNNSAFDGFDPGPGAADDAALAIDKTALRPGTQAAFQHYSSFIQGINGVFVDVIQLPGMPSFDDFLFRSGNHPDLSTWMPAPVPESISVRPGAGVGGSDRITLIWGADAVRNAWLEIRVLNTPATGLGEVESFYFGNAVGDTGDRPTDAVVDPADELRARSNPRNVLNPADITDPHDFNRDGLVDPQDQLIARSNQTTVLNALQLFLPEEGGGGHGPGTEWGVALSGTVASDVSQQSVTPVMASLLDSKLSSPTLSRIQITSDGRWLQWSVPASLLKSNQVPKVEQSDDLTPDSWRPVDVSPLSEWDGARAIWTWQVPLGAGAARFYRVVP